MVVKVVKAKSRYTPWVALGGRGDITSNLF
jgi:hypothetical protein